MGACNLERVRWPAPGRAPRIGIPLATNRRHRRRPSMIIYPSIAGRFVPALRTLTPAEIRSIMRRIRQDSLHRYNVAFALAWLGALAGIALTAVPVHVGISFVARCASVKPWPMAVAAVTGGLAPLLANVFYSALIAHLLKRDIVARIARDQWPPG
ncbi:hypothetical protein [Burkholderia stagnalis]|uniref:hypothetical protein n=1 Tax=Burkholderia stagnalis TaxID=1503054 RepID=UPI001E5ADE1F|nr:hypothetical protein [Burkholderia stagnalis]